MKMQNRVWNFFDMENDPKQYTNLAYKPEYSKIVDDFQQNLRDKLEEVRTNDLGIDYSKKKK